MIYLCNKCQRINDRVLVQSQIILNVEVCCSCKKELSGDLFSLYTNRGLLSQFLYPSTFPSNMRLFYDDIKLFLTNKKDKEAIRAYLISCSTQQENKVLRNFSFDVLNNFNYKEFFLKYMENKFVIDASGNILEISLTEV